MINISSTSLCSGDENAISYHHDSCDVHFLKYVENLERV